MANEPVAEGAEVRPVAGVPSETYRQAVRNGNIRDLGGARFHLTAAGAEVAKAALT